ncbi:endomembrane protein EMP70 [Ascosphaera apis ARSEF 7405]|uniref:Transmembrane 9 superfamily member n=1 Tax=Ascosphaera apis ARSEF 7405 TaxID=392613 RepID=A0A167W1D8_9EURO|nr:endomembrane protein EMP70 [Ascosphaera apis ARSEF 7405]
MQHINPSALLWAGLAMLPALGNAFYLPGVAPTSYDKDQRVPLYVNRLTPTFSDKDSQVHSMFSYDYYYPKFHFCQPEGGPQSVRESLGSIIFGDRIMTSPFELHMAKDETCKALCKSKFDADSAEFINQQIIAAYNLNWLIDGLPAAQINVDDATKEEFYSPGFLLGEQSEEGKPILFNHYNIVIEYHRVAGYTGSAEPKYRVVGVLVVPESLADTKINDDGSVQCGFEGGPLSLKEDGETEVPWTYSVVWKESDTVWATRWDKYLHVYDPNVHWYSLIYSSIFVIVLVAFVTTILVRTLRKDIARYNRLDAIDLDDLNDTSVEDGIAEDSGWKLVHGDVFRAPSRPMLLAVLTGTGAQLFAMTAITVVFAMFGLLSPSHRGMLSTTIIILYTFLGSVGGYTAARVYKSFGGEEWKKLIIMTPLLIPGIAFAVFFILNFFVWIKGSSGAVPFTTMLIVVAIWFLISVPLSVVGSWVGFRRDAFVGPTKTNQIPRQIPPATGALRPIPSTLITGLLPFAAIFVELFFIMTSIWTSKIYYMFGFLFICFFLMLLTTAAATILLVYFLLCAEDYRWQWRSFFGAGMTGGYVCLNALIFWASRISFATLTGTVLYLGYSVLLGLLVFILTGTIGFLSSWVFVHRIYGSIKVD